MDSLVVKDGLALPNYAPSAPMAIVSATETSVDFDIIAARPGLSIPIKKIWTTTTDFEIQQNPNDNGGGSSGGGNDAGMNTPTWTNFIRPGRGSVFGSTGSVLDSLKTKLFNHDAVSATPSKDVATDPFGTLRHMFRRFQPSGAAAGKPAEISRVVCDAHRAGVAIGCARALRSVSSSIRALPIRFVVVSCPAFRMKIQF